MKRGWFWTCEYKKESITKTLVPTVIKKKKTLEAIVMLLWANFKQYPRLKNMWTNQTFLDFLGNDARKSWKIQNSIFLNSIILISEETAW